MRYLFFLTYFFGICVAFAQTDNLELINSRPLKADRYQEIKGSPYYYDDWTYARVLNNNGQFIDSVLVNYNGLTNEFEATNGTSFIRLVESSHQRIEVYGSNGSLADIFIIPWDFDVGSSYVLINYNGNSIKWVTSFTVRINELKTNTPGKTEVSHKFVKNRVNYMVIGGRPNPFRMKKRKILEALSQFPEAAEIAKGSDLDIESKEDLITLLKAIDR